MATMKIMNGRAPWSVCKLLGVRIGSSASCYIGYTSLAQAEQMLRDLGERMPMKYEFAEYWNKNAWGNSMSEIAPEVGVWATRDHLSKPVRLWPPAREKAGDGKP